MILFCFAVKEEAGPFRRRMQLRRADPESFQVLVTGMGRPNAARAADQAMEGRKPDLVITSGFAGGLDPALARGAVVFEAPQNHPLEALLRDNGALPVRFCCTEKVAVTVAEKRALRQKTGAGAVEMESEAIGEICRARGITCVTVRVISDAAGEDLPLDFNRFMNHRQELSLPRLILALLGSPRLIPGLIRFGKQTAQASETLARVLERVAVQVMARGETRGRT